MRRGTNAWNARSGGCEKRTDGNARPSRMAHAQCCDGDSQSCDGWRVAPAESLRQPLRASARRPVTRQQSPVLAQTPRPGSFKSRMTSCCAASLILRFTLLTVSHLLQRLAATPGYPRADTISLHWCLHFRNPLLSFDHILRWAASTARSKSHFSYP